MAGSVTHDEALQQDLTDAIARLGELAWISWSPDIRDEPSVNDQFVIKAAAQRLVLSTKPGQLEAAVAAASRAAGETIREIITLVMNEWDEHEDAGSVRTAVQHVAMMAERSMAASVLAKFHYVLGGGAR